MANKYYFNTKDLLLIAILSCLGGVASTYVGYVGSTFSIMTGLPMGGQMLSGLHIFWLILILAIVDKKGSGVLAGLLKGFAEFATGSHLGILVIATSLLEGIFVEIGFWPLKKYNRTLAYLIAGGLGSWANILITQTLFNAFPGIELFGTLSVYSFVSGVIFGGLMGLGIVKALSGAGVVKEKEEKKPSMVSRLTAAAAILIFAFVAMMLILHFAVPMQAPIFASTSTDATTSEDSIVFTDQCKSMGNITYDLLDYKSKFVNVTAVDPTGGNTVPKNYTGLPLVDLVNMQCPGGGPRFVEVIKEDGTSQIFKVPEVRRNTSIIIVPNGTSFDIVAPGYPEEMWVKNGEKFMQY